MSDEKPMKATGPSARSIIAWGLGMLAVLGLAWFAGAVVVPAWRTRAAIERSGSEPHSKVIESLGGPERAARELALYLHLPGPLAPHRRSAAAMLGECGGHAVPELVRLLRDDDGDLRALAAFLLGRIGDGRAVGPLIAALKDGRKPVLTNAAWALGKIGDGRAVEPLAAALGDKSRESGLRCCMAEALGELGSPRALAPLAAALKDRDANVRRGAARALGKLGDGRAAGPLRAALGDKEELVRAAAREALGKLRAEAGEKRDEAGSR